MHPREGYPLEAPLEGILKKEEEEATIGNKYQGAAKGGAIGCLQTQTNADFRLSEKGPKTQVNERKREQTQTNANKRKIKELHPLLRTPFYGTPPPKKKDISFFFVAYSSLVAGFL